ncbi:hypothetical protein FDF12_05095 [Clostridium botulinum]|nr:hypothetical protein [Clostridium botulinum]NFS54024.1 hypothetical protein [Clostridium botulinum]NFT16797.1 hypothetical protein [Clostridium botulinum]
MYYLLYLCNIYNVKINKVETLNLIENLDIDSLIKKATSDKEIYFLYNIAKILDKDFNSKACIEKINGFYNIEFNSYSNDTQNNIANIYSTYRMLSVLKDLKVEDININKDKINNFLDNVRGEKGGYFINYDDKLKDEERYKTNFTWQNLYYAYSINKILD